MPDPTPAPARKLNKAGKFGRSRKAGASMANDAEFNGWQGSLESYGNARLADLGLVMKVLLHTMCIASALLSIGCASHSDDRWRPVGVGRPANGSESPAKGAADDKRESLAPAPRQGSREAWWPLRQGMTQAEVLQLLGEPRSNSVYAAMRQEVWWYQAPGNVGFEPIGGRVVDWHTPDF